MSRRRCQLCLTEPVMQCGRCTTTRCVDHALAAGRRCDGCEREWADDVVTRRAAKLMFAPSVAVLTGGLLFGLLLPVSIGGALGAVVMCGLACGSAVGAGAAACRAVEKSARSLFMRERAGRLPPARLLPSPRHR